MSWQQSIQVAVKALKQEEGTLRKQLDTVVSKIRELEDIGRGAGSAGLRKRAGSRRLSAAGRAAISRAAKKRWAQYRASAARGKK